MKTAPKSDFRVFFSIVWIIFCSLTYNLLAQSNNNSSVINASKDKSDLQSNNDIFGISKKEINVDQFPTATINFSIIRNDNKKIYELKAQDVKATVDDQPLVVESEALTTDNPVKILFMIDRSGSMDREGKLKAAKDALKYFIRNLKKNDEIVISIFDENSETVTSAPVKVENSSQIDNFINNIEISNSQYTYFYNAVEYAIKQAQKYEIENIIFLSDGKEDTPGDDYKLPFKDLSPEEKASYKSEREKKSIDLLKNRRFFSIAIGNPNLAESEEGFVDYKSMEKISNSDVSDRSRTYLIDTPTIAERAGEDETKKEQLIADELKNILNRIKEAIKFDYQLHLNLPQLKSEGGNLKLTLNLRDGKNSWFYPIDYPYSKKNGKWVFEKGTVGKPFIETAELNWNELSKIYLLFLSPLALLAVIPSIFKKLSSVANNRKVSKSIIVLRRNSGFIGKMCPNEFTGGNTFAFTVGDTVISCPKCKVVHHLQCWEESGSYCLNKRCQRQFVIPSKVLKKYKV